MTIEKLRKRQVEVETMLWDGTEERAAEIKKWVGWRPTNIGPRPAFLPAAEMAGASEHAQLYVAHNGDWCSLPVGYRVAKELDGSGFYPLSPDGAAAGYHLDDGPWHLDVPVVPEHITCFREERTGRLWVLRSGAWFRWNGAITAGARLLGELFAHAPLVEHPDPRKATT